MIFSNKIIDLKYFNPTLINYINDTVKNNAFLGTTIVFESTKGLTSEMVELINKSSKLKFRISGAFDSKRIESKKISKKQIEEEYIEPVTYSREELFNILIVIERMEESIPEEISDLEKALYIYNNLNKYFNYKYHKDTVSNKEASSFRGLVTKNINAKGIALIFQELMRRQSIEAHYVEGKLKSEEFEIPHFWNIIQIDGKFIPLDLYLEIEESRKGYFGELLYFGEINSFSETHVPGNTEIIQFYNNSLFAISKQDLIDSFKNIFTNKEYKFKINAFKRSNGTEGVFSFVESEQCLEKEYQKIIYFDVVGGNTIENPSILYLDANIEFIEEELFIDKVKVDEAGYKILYEKVLDPTNIRTGITLNNGYIGTLKNEDNILKFSYDSKVKDNIKNFQKLLVRSDNTTFVLEQLNTTLEGEIVSTNKYKIYELLYNEEYYVSEKIIYTEKDIIGNNSAEFINNILSVKNINNAVLYKSGYLGYFNPAEIKIIDKKESEQ